MRHVLDLPSRLTEGQSQIEAVLLQQRLQEQLREATKGINADFKLKYMEAKTQPELFPNTVIGFGALRRGMLSSMHIQPDALVVLGLSPARRTC